MVSHHDVCIWRSLISTIVTTSHETLKRDHSEICTMAETSAKCMLLVVAHSTLGYCKHGAADTISVISTIFSPYGQDKLVQSLWVPAER